MNDAVYKWPWDDLDNPINLLICRRTCCTAGKHEVDRINQTRQRLWEIGRLKQTESSTKSRLTTTHRHTHRHTQSHTQRHTDTHTVRHTDRRRLWEIGHLKQTESSTKSRLTTTHRHTHRHTQSDTHRDTQSDTHRDTQSDIHRDTQSDIQTPPFDIYSQAACRSTTLKFWALLTYHSNKNGSEQTTHQPNSLRLRDNPLQRTHTDCLYIDS